MIEQEIQKARELVFRKKKEYDAAVEKLSLLPDDQKRLDAAKNMTLDSGTFTWNGEATWDCGNGTVDCAYCAKVEFNASKDARGPEVTKLQIDKPDFSPEDLYLALEKSLRKR